MKKLKTAIWVMLLLLGIILVVQNSDAMFQEITFKLNLFFTVIHSKPLPFWLLVGIAFAVGLLLSFVIGFMGRRKLKKEYRGKEKAYTELLEEVNTLREKVGYEKGDTAGGADAASEV